MYNLSPHYETIDESQTQIKFTNPSNLIFERKFDTAMRESHMIRFMRRIKEENISREDRVILENKKFNADNVKFDESLYARILNDILRRDKVSRIEVNQSKIKTITRIIRNNLTLQTDFQIETIKIPLWKMTRKRKFQEYLNNVQIPAHLAHMISLVDKINTIVDKLNDAYHYKIHGLEDDEYVSYCIRKNRLIIDDDLELYWNKEYLFCSYKDDLYLLPRVYILMIHNKLCDLISVLVLSMYSNQSVFPHDSTDRIVNFVLELCSLFLRFKRKFFSISKVIEALCYAETLLEVEEWRNVEFLSEICSGLLEINFDYMTSDLRTYIITASAEFRHELCCLSKIVGHPLVDMEAGAKAIHKKVTEEYNLTVEQLVRCECYIKQNYIRNHILTGRGWPPVNIDQGAPETLKTAWIKNLDPDADALKKKYKPIDIMDYMFVEILPNLMFNKLENIIPHLKDKTVSLSRRKIIAQIIDRQMDQERPKWEETRLLLVYLMNPSYVTDHVKYLDDINQGVSIEEFHNYLVCRIVPKEKEHKVEFRGFGCKTPQDRARSLAQEMNSKHYLDLFSDEQAMTLSELDLTKVLHSFRHLEDAYKGYRVLYITLDASSWNNHFRKETVDDLMVNTLSRIFNHQVFSNTHKFYKNCLHYVPDADTTYYWYGQDGGIEGLNQDTWVITYIAQIKTTLHDKNLRYHIMCKGDDFRLAVLIPIKNLEDKTLKEYKDDIVRTISIRAKELGQKIKVEESFGSARYFMFSKHASIDKVEMPETIRKIMKCHGSNNSFINTCDEYIGSTFSNAHSACKASPIAIPQYAVALFWSLFYLTRHHTYKDCLDLEYETFLLVPSMCGGFPIIYLHNMYVRAESDLLSPFLYIIDHCSTYRPELAKLLKKFCIISIDPPTDYIQLYKDPYSLPSPRPRLPSAVLRQAVLPSLKRIIKNENVLELLEAQESTAQTMCEKALNSSNHLVIKLLSRIYSATPSAIIEELTRKFESSRSILELLITAKGRRRAMNVLRNVIKCETRLQRWRIDVLHGEFLSSKNFYQVNYSKCPGEFSDKVREWAWKKKIVGITMPAIQHLVTYTSINFANPHDIKNHFTYTISDNLKYSSSSKNRCFADGHQKPFLGHVTNPGTVSSQLRFVQKDVVLRHVSDLLEIHAWSQLAQTSDEEGNIITGNLHVLIEKLLKLCRL
uniref:RNA-directed RNA polymerase n=1 Tax=Shuangao Fly Virus 1 TaxID=1608073 RepID=A0A0B5KJY4_9VIRU|nr:polymerase [Shuangao Fly Virus 1]